MSSAKCGGVLVLKTPPCLSACAPRFVLTSTRHAAQGTNRIVYRHMLTVARGNITEYHTLALRQSQRCVLVSVQALV